MATHTSILAWGISWTESLAGYSSWGCKESEMTRLVCTQNIFRFSLLTVNRHSDCLHVLVIVNCATINTGMNALFQIIVSFRYIPRVGFLDHMVALLLVFIRKFHSVPQWLLLLLLLSC